MRRQGCQMKLGAILLHKSHHKGTNILQPLNSILVRTGDRGSFGGCQIWDGHFVQCFLFVLFFGGVMFKRAMWGAPFFRAPFWGSVKRDTKSETTISAVSPMLTRRTLTVMSRHRTGRPLGRCRAIRGCRELKEIVAEFDETVSWTHVGVVFKGT